MLPTLMGLAALNGLNGRNECVGSIDTVMRLIRRIRSGKIYVRLTILADFA